MRKIDNPDFEINLIKKAPADIISWNNQNTYPSLASIISLVNVFKVCSFTFSIEQPNALYLDSTPLFLAQLVDSLTLTISLSNWEERLKKDTTIILKLKTIKKVKMPTS